MTAHRIVAIPQSTAAAVRSTLASPQYGHPAHVEMATGYGPCRLCLRFFVLGGEERILFTYDPFAETSDPPMPGPVFIHRTDCERYPEDGGFPERLLAHPLTLCAYGEGRKLLAEDPLIGPPGEALEALLGLPGVRYLHVRDTEAGCFDLRVERSKPPR